MRLLLRCFQPRVDDRGNQALQGYEGDLETQRFGRPRGEALQVPQGYAQDHRFRIRVLDVRIRRSHRSDLRSR